MSCQSTQSSTPGVQNKTFHYLQLKIYENQCHSVTAKCLLHFPFPPFCVLGYHMQLHKAFWVCFLFIISPLPSLSGEAHCTLQYSLPIRFLLSWIFLHYQTVSTSNDDINDQGNHISIPIFLTTLNSIVLLTTNT